MNWEWKGVKCSNAWTIQTKDELKWWLVERTLKKSNVSWKWIWKAKSSFIVEDRVFRKEYRRISKERKESLIWTLKVEARISYFSKRRKQQIWYIDKATHGEEWGTLRLKLRKGCRNIKDHLNAWKFDLAKIRTWEKD